MSPADFLTQDHYIEVGSIHLDLYDEGNGELRGGSGDQSGDLPSDSSDAGAYSLTP